jgi:hypothetical protein
MFFSVRHNGGAFGLALLQCAYAKDTPLAHVSGTPHHSPHPLGVGKEI